MRIYLLLAMAVGASFIGSSCGGSGVGDPCIPEKEYDSTFNGFSVTEVNVESRSFQCITRLCLVNHFQGRVSCPYGQTQDATTKCISGTEEEKNACRSGGSSHGSTCRVPDRSGDDPSERIQVPVSEQLQNRQADNSVYCSCRCAGPDEGARYCDCPSGFECEPLIDDIDFGAGQLPGSYCIKQDTAYDPTNIDRIGCDSTGASCGSAIRGTDGALIGVNPPNANILTDAEFTASSN